eukprot:m.259819 g.259819  ORF g.259819 m.259819 type:complete len:153 (+) comp38727_c0_seq1:193-651(+)
MARSRFDSTNPNVSWFGNRGFLMWYFGVIVVCHLTILAFPFITTPWAWTTTIFLHSTITFYFFHWEKGTPVPTVDNTEAEFKTLWEQIDEEDEVNFSKLFLFLLPIAGFIIAVEYTEHDHIHFWINLACTMLSILPKLPMLQRVRLFGINEH